MALAAGADAGEAGGGGVDGGAAAGTDSGGRRQPPSSAAMTAAQNERRIALVLKRPAYHAPCPCLVHVLVLGRWRNPPLAQL